jgi:hypothetical protein
MGTMRVVSSMAAIRRSFDTPTSVSPRTHSMRAP